MGVNLPAQKPESGPNIELAYVQWHTTARCPLRCAHCYVYDSQTFPREVVYELGFDQCSRILNSLRPLMTRPGSPGHIAFTGGDVFLREDLFFRLAEMASDFGIRCSVLGNPDLVTSDRAARLRRTQVRSYQISLDGMERQHDMLRRPGSFLKSLDALRALQDAGLRTCVMFTLSPVNAADLVSVMQLAAEIGVSAFGFDRLSRAGNAARAPQDEFLPLAYREICLTYLIERRRLRSAGYRTRFALKSHLFKLLLHEMGEIDDADIETDSGCPAGRKSIAILADGGVLPCSRIPIVAGNAAEQPISEILSQTGITRFQVRDNYLKCRNCELYFCCRGCPAVAYGSAGDPFAGDPQCWRAIS